MGQREQMYILNKDFYKIYFQWPWLLTKHLFKVIAHPLPICDNIEMAIISKGPA